jgi:hypothetical protein
LAAKVVVFDCLRRILKVILINLGSDELKEILADAHIFKKAQVATVIVEGDGQRKRGQKGYLRVGRI